jgi:hypothetical protein
MEDANQKFSVLEFQMLRGHSHEESCQINANSEMHDLKA